MGGANRIRIAPHTGVGLSFHGLKSMVRSRKIRNAAEAGGEHRPEHRQPAGSVESNNISFSKEMSVDIMP